MHYHIHFTFRVDPTAVSDVKEETPVEIAVSRNCSEVFNILSEYTDVSDTLKLKLKLNILAKLMDADSDNAEEFKKTLSSLPLDLVG